MSPDRIKYPNTLNLLKERNPEFNKHALDFAARYANEARQELILSAIRRGLIYSTDKTNLIGVRTRTLAHYLNNSPELKPEDIGNARSILSEMHMLDVLRMIMPNNNMAVNFAPGRLEKSVDPLYDRGGGHISIRADRR